jgi:hypothetical protein
MDGQPQHDLKQMSKKELAALEELQEDMEDEKEDDAFEQMLDNIELQEDYPAPQPDEKMNAHTFLHKAAFASKDTVRTTFLQEGELGRPLFTVRFLMDMHDVSKYYLDPLLKKLKLDEATYNGIANYFWEKIQNITQSGMSNKGFAMNLNVTQKRDTVRTRNRNTEGLKNQPK